MSGFDYTIKYRDTKSHANADFLSRFPQDKIQDKHFQDDSIFQLSQIETLPVTLKDIQKETLKDADCRAYFNALQQGNDLPNHELAHAFSIEKGCVFNGIRVMIPKVLQQKILEQLHEAHTGIVRMKALARSYVWWRGIDRDIENLTRQCPSCCKIKFNPSKASPHPWDYPSHPWQRIHIDYAGPFYEHNLFIVVDAYTKWIEVIPTKSTTSRATIKMLREMFSRFGLPVTLVSDNATSFKSVEFELFLKSNGITHKLCAPYHPSSNGQVERYVQTVKQGLRAMMTESGDFTEKLYRLLMQYRKVPNSSTGLSPSELMFKRSIRTKIDLVKKDLSIEMNEKYKQLNNRVREFEIGDKIQARFYNNKNVKWKFGIVINKKGDRLYDILIDNETHTRHIDQLRPTECELTLNDKTNTYDNITDNDQTSTMQEKQTDKPQISDPEGSSDDNVSQTQQATKPMSYNTGEHLTSQVTEGRRKSQTLNEDNPRRSAPSETKIGDNPTRGVSTPQLRRSTRTRRAPQRYQPQ